MTSVPVAEPPPRESPGRRLSTFFYRHPRIRLGALLALPVGWLVARLLRVALRASALVALGDRPVHARRRPRRSRSTTSSASSRRRCSATSRGARSRWPCSSRSPTSSSRSRSRTTWPASPRHERATCSSSPCSCRSGRTISSRPSPGGRSSPRAASSTGRSSRSGSTFDGYSTVGLWLVFTYLWLPFMILPIYAGLERIPSSLLEASADLGGRSLTHVHARDPARSPSRRLSPARSSRSL